jgi:hypothetical protein
VTTRERFCLTVDRFEDGRVRCLSLEVTPPHQPAHLIRCNGFRAVMAAASVHSILRRAKLVREWTGDRPIELDSGPGDQVALLLTAIRPLRRTDRMERVAAGVAAMASEEASYWYAKSHGPRGLRALRVLLSAEDRSR